MAKKQWIDETGLQIPAARVSKSEKLREATAEALLKKAQKLNQQLAQFKKEVAQAADAVFEAVMAENGATMKEERKGNFVFYNFDRSIKIEVDAQERIEFDDALIAVAKQHFDDFLNVSAGGVEDMIRELILDAFSSSRGKLDTRKVIGLVRYRQRIPADKYPQFHRAIDAIEKSMTRPSSKRYFRISTKEEWGTYNLIDLNFSSIS